MSLSFIRLTPENIMKIKKNIGGTSPESGKRAIIKSENKYL